MRVIVTAAAIVRDEARLATLETFGKEHGRLEERRYWQIGKMEWFTDRQESDIPLRCRSSRNCG